jgi:Flp pilus assembly protein TadD
MATTTRSDMATEAIRTAAALKAPSARAFHLKAAEAYAKVGNIKEAAFHLRKAGR